MAKNGLPSQVLFQIVRILVGDTNHDWEVAEALGVDCLLLTNGHQDMGTLSSFAAPKINELCEVLELFT